MTTPLVSDVYVRYSPRGRYSLFAAAVDLTDAYEKVEELRSDPAVDWAYCTDPREGGEEC